MPSATSLGTGVPWDNLKKVLISATPFPWMNGLEKSWRGAAELAADDAAVQNRQEALDLAAALIKLSRAPKCSQPEPALASGLVCGVILGAAAGGTPPGVARRRTPSATVVEVAVDSSCSPYYDGRDCQPL